MLRVGDRYVHGIAIASWLTVRIYVLNVINILQAVARVLEGTFYVQCVSYVWRNWF